MDVYDEPSSSPSTSSSISSLSGAEDDTSLDLNGAGSSTGATCGGHAKLRRLWAAARAGAPGLREACEDAARDVAAWTRQGGKIRALLVVSVGSASLAAQTGLLVVAVFVAAAATNAIIWSLLVSLFAAGGFLAVLLAFLASVYVGALSLAVFVIGTATAATVIVVTVATGWVGLGWIVCFAATKCFDLVRPSD